MFRHPCPGCDKNLWVDEFRVGTKITCPHCGHRFIAPPAGSEAPSRPEAKGSPGAGPRRPRAQPDRPKPKPPPAARPPRDLDFPAIPPAPPRAAKPPPEPPLLETETFHTSEGLERSAPSGRFPAERPKARADDPSSGDGSLAEVIEDVELDEDESAADDSPSAEPERRRKSDRARREGESGVRRKKKRRRQRPPQELGGLLAALAVVAAVWLLLTVAAYFKHQVAYALLVLGGVAAFAGKRWFLAVASEDGLGTRLMCLFVPFYSTYYFFTNLRRTLMPFAVSCCGGVFLLTGVVFWYAHKFEEARTEAAAPSEKLATQDAECAQLLAEPNHAEALEWLKAENKRRAVFKWGKKQAIDLVENLYRRGAVKVYVADISSDQVFGELTAQMVVVLPEDAAARKKLFEWYNSSFGDDVQKDQGQKYLLLTLD